MAKTLRNIEQSVKNITNDDAVVLTDGFGRKLFNRTYRGLVALFSWPEFLRRAVLTSPTVVSQENYQWTGEDFPSFIDLKYVEIESDSYDSPTTSSDIFGTSTLTEATSRNTYKMLFPPPDEFEWDRAGRQAGVDAPQYFRLFRSNRHIIVAADVGSGTNRWHSVNDGTTWVQTTSTNIGDEVRYYAATADVGTGASTATETNRLAIRPVPTVAGYIIRAFGVIEPTELSTSAGTTQFINSSADDALEHILAAAWFFNYKDSEQANIQLQQAVERLKSVFKNEQITTETISGLI
jgi:hypothetical protein